MPAGTAVADETAGEVSKQVNYSSKKLGGLLLAFFVVLGIATIGSSTAQAQYPDYRRDRDRDYRRDRDRDYRRDRDDRYRLQFRTPPPRKCNSAAK